MEKKQPSVSFAALGCKVSQYEIEALREAFLLDGFTECKRDADIVLVNTCTVTEEADRKCRKAVRRLHRQNPSAHILLLGCYAQSAPDAASDLPGVSYVGGTADKMRALAVAKSLLGRPHGHTEVAVRGLDGEAYEPMEVSSSPRTRAYVKIADGCDCHCTYCAIPAARGPVRSRPKEEILCEVKRLAEGGVREVVLIGIETASYGRDRHDGYRLIDLLEEVDRLPIERFRLGSLTPEVLRGDFIPRAARLTRLAPHFHLSVQSGSSAVLASMRRRYNADMAMDAIKELKAAIPGVQLTADVIVGFPGESKENFMETVRFCEEAGFLSMHVFAYSPRAGTPAAAMEGQIPECEKAERSAQLSSLARQMGEEILRGAVASGEPLSVLFETASGGIATGHTPSFLPVRVKTGRRLGGRVLSCIPIGIEDGCILSKIEE